MTGSAGDQLRQLARTTNSIYIFELFAMIVTIRKLLQRPIGRKLLTLVNNEAARAAPTRSSAKNDLGLLLRYSLLEITDEYNITLWVDMVPSDLNTADGRSNGK